MVVTDKNGQHVNDLNENDFEFLVDGKPQSISYFKLIKVPTVKREAPANPKADPKNEPVKPPSERRFAITGYARHCNRPKRRPPTASSYHRNNKSNNDQLLGTGRCCPKRG